MRRLAARLERDGWLVTIAAPALGVRDVGRRAERLAAALASVRRAAGGATIDVVAHGTGGLIARACLAAAGGAAGVGRLVTLGTPHQGSVAFRWFRLDPLAAALCPSAPALVRLGTDDRLPDLVDCTAIASAADVLTVPVERAYWPGAFNVTVQGVGHVGLLYSAAVYELIRENLAAAPEPAYVRAPRPA
jgi:pimeloyl-ACP methyl ester carboxylesterase